MTTTSSQPAFTSGFTLGLFAGVVGYYLFGTDQGKKLWQKLSQEWVLAVDQLQQEGVLEVDQDYKNLAEFFAELKMQFLKKLEIEPIISKKPQSKKRYYDKKIQPKKFKGV